MRQPLPALVTLLVVAAAVSAGAPLQPSGTAADTAAAPAADAESSALPLSSPRNTTEYLGFEDGRDTRARYGNATLDVGTAAAIDGGRLRESFALHTYQYTFASASNASAKTEVLTEATENLDNRTTALEEQYRLTLARYNSGEIALSTALGRIGAIQARANQIQAGTAELSQQVNRDLGYVLPSSLEATPILLQSPIRSDVEETILGQRGTVDVYVEASDDGLVLARVAGNRYIRDAFVGGSYDPGAPAELTLDEALERARTLYPWVHNNSIESGSLDSIGPFYRYTIDHTQGQLTTFVDGTTGEVFREVQVKRLEDIPATGTVRSRNTTGVTDLAIRANLTHGSGPMHLTVRDPGINATVDARVRVDGQFVGRTGSDGQLWAIQPSGDATVTAVDGDERVTLRITDG